MAILFATGDVWPSVNVGFTLRLSQLLLLLAMALSPAVIYSGGVRLFPGWQWLGGFITWIIITVPMSLYLERTVPYVMWAVTDALIIFAFVQYFPTIASLQRLLRFYLISVLLLSLFGLLQFFLGLVGIDVLVSQWYIPGRLARINGLSYEPSYYSTYMLVGWVASLYLLEKRAPFPSRKLQRACAFTSTVALILCTSKLGWSLMLAYLAIRLLRRTITALLRAKIRLRTAAIVSTLPLVAGVIAASTLSQLQKLSSALEAISFLLSGTGLAGQDSYSVSVRGGALQSTWNAWLSHPLSGTGIGALPMDIAMQNGGSITSLADAKDYEGLNVFVELLASTGLIGASLLFAFAIAIVLTIRRRATQLPSWLRIMVAALSWGIVWMLVALQFSPTFLRIPIFINLAVLMCCFTAGAGMHTHAHASQDGAAHPPVSPAQPVA